MRLSRRPSGGSGCGAGLPTTCRAEALASAGDPGPVVLRRLSNAEYTYTLLDLTGVDLQPAREFPVDGAAGEGFTNTGNALVMSPALLSKYLDAGKKIASHAVLLPDGIRFSPGATRRDWTDETLAQIRSFYGRFTETGGGTQVNLQGIVFGTNDGGLLPLEKYLRATIRHRDDLAAGAKSIADVAAQEGLNAKYLGILWSTLHACRSFADSGRCARSLADGASRGRSRARLGDFPVAEGTLAVHERRADRQGRRPEGLDGAGQPDRRRTGAAAQDAGSSAGGEVTLYLVARRRRRR